MLVENIALSSPKFFDWVQASVVGFVLTEEEIAAACELARGLGVARFRVRGR